MDAAKVDPLRTAAIILGASEFPKSSLVASEQFKRSAGRFRDYLLGPDGFGMPEANLLDLFDSPALGDELDERVGQFLKDRSRRGADSQRAVDDLIVYYVGHGGTASNDFYLAIRATRESNRGASSYAIKSLGKTLKEDAAHLRRYLILDCCFAAAAYKELQAGPLAAAVHATQDVLPPTKGTALLCASGPRNPAKAPPGLELTMFSSALLEVLTSGIRSAAESFSLETLAEHVMLRIRDDHADEGVRPEIHFPDQVEGTLGDLLLFPNPARRVRSADPRVAELQQALHVLKSRYDNLERERAEDRARFEALRATRPMPKPPAFDTPLSQDIHAFAGGHPITKVDWRDMPGHHKATILRARTARHVGWAWMAMTVAIAAFAFAIPFLNFGSPHQFAITTWMALALDVIAAFLSFRPLLAERNSPVMASAKAGKASSREVAWEDHAAVVWAKSLSVHALFHGLPVSGAALGIGGVASTLGLALILAETRGLTLLFGL